MISLTRNTVPALLVASMLAITPSLATAETAIKEVSVRYDGGGYDMLNSAAVDVYGNMYVTGGRGNYAAPGANTYFLAKYDSTGKLKWEKTHSTGAASWFGQQDTMAVDRAGNAYVALSESYYFGRVLKYDPNGNETILVDGSTTPYSYDHSIGLLLDNQENNLFLRASNYIQKISLNGGAGWNKQLATYNTWVRDIAVDNAGNVYAVGQGWNLNSTNTQDVVVKKFDPSGNELWKQTIDTGAGYDENGAGIGLDSSGNVYVLTQTIKYDSTCPSGACITSSVVKYSNSGSRLGSTNLVSGTNRTMAGKLKIGPDNSIYVTYRNDSKMISAKLGSNLSLVWSADFLVGTSPTAMDVDAAGSLVVTAPVGGEMNIIKYSNTGNQLWVQKNDGGLSLSMFVKFGPTTEIYAAGTSRNLSGVSTNPYDSVMYRYRTTGLNCQ